MDVLSIFVLVIPFLFLISVFICFYVKNTTFLLIFIKKLSQLTFHAFAECHFHHFSLNNYIELYLC